MRQILTSVTAGTKIVYLFLLMFIGLLLAGSILIAFSAVTGVEEGGVTIIYLSSGLQAFFAFVMPAYLVTGWSFPGAAQYLKMVDKEHAGRKIILAIMVFLLSYIPVFLLTQWNKGIELPESMQIAEQWMRSMEDAAQETTDLLLSGESIGRLFMNLFIIAGLAAVAEEMFFRGALQQLIQEKFRNGHIAVWIGALIFSVVHFQFYGFFPRLLLGALLGYLFLYTQNLWIPVLMHFVNNAAVIVLAYFWRDSEWLYNIENSEITAPFAIMALICLLLTILLFRLYKKNLRTSVQIEVDSC